MLHVSDGLEGGSMKKMWYVLGGLVVFTVLSRTLGTIGMDTVKNLTINKMDMSRIPDGVYEGRYHHSRWDYSVSVTVKDHRITGVQVLDGEGSMAGRFSGMVTRKQTDEAAARVVSFGYPTVDAVSGATVSEKALVKAIENALTAATE